MPVKHDLYQDLGLSKEVVHERRASDKRLDSLLTQYDAADGDVLEAESRKADDREVEVLKKKRLLIKDQIAGRLDA
ncbi:MULTISPECIES: YdcH family protein [unclassified Pseudomonas]|uniref:YdcH family protein n=1 Tax=unclassified Pseudomonas TaxID=196821 RepID=UPI0020032ADE|nr:MULTISPECIES: YdcH family protein [unclassified Pseudomonas]MCK6190515.1 YdcH family protein [Pseudomonas sp. EYE_354]WLH66417.1 YdcH family protein [Pseudomonas sp. FP2309]